MSEISIPIHDIELRGILDLPKDARGLVIFAHGSGSGRLSPRNQFVSKFLQKGSLGTLLFDLLTEEEEAIDEIDRSLRFDIPMLADRLYEVTNWLMKKDEGAKLPLGYFGASTGAAAALCAAAKLGNRIKAVVSRGGRPDLAGEQALKKVKAPTLLIVGARDAEVIQLNEMALRLMECEKKILLIPHATHLFEEEGALEQAALDAKSWFLKYLFN